MGETEETNVVLDLESPSKDPAVKEFPQSLGKKGNAFEAGAIQWNVSR